MPVFLIDITAHDGAGQVTLRYGTRSYRTKPSDTPANALYRSKLKSMGGFDRSMLGRGSTFGQIDVGIGDIELINNDGSLDALVDYGFAGFPCTIWWLDDVASPYNSRTLWLKGTIEQVEFGWRSIRLLFRDALFGLKKPAQESVFAGTNSGITGLEGTPQDIGGRVKPMVFGKVSNISPSPVNTSLLMFGCNYDVAGNRKAVQSISVCYDNGVALTAGTNYATATLLAASTPAAGGYNTCLAEGLVMLGSTPAGTITADILEGATAVDRTPGQIAKRMLEEWGYTTSDYVADTITALDTACDDEVGIYLPDTMTRLEGLQKVLASAHATIIANAAGQFELQQFTAPAGTPEASLVRLDFITNGAGLERIPTGDKGNGVPAWRVRVLYDRNYTMQSGDQLAGSVDAERRAYLAQDYREAVAEDATIKTKWPEAVEMTVETLLTSKADADALAASLVALYKVRRDRFLLPVKAEKVEGIELSNVVRLKLPRFGLDAGKLFKVIGINYDRPGRVTTLDVIG